MVTGPVMIRGAEVEVVAEVPAVVEEEMVEVMEMAGEGKGMGAK